MSQLLIKTYNLIANHFLFRNFYSAFTGTMLFFILLQIDVHFLTCEGTIPYLTNTRDHSI